jgi:hypothetical protein
MQHLISILCFRFFKQALNAASTTREERIHILTQIRAVEAEILLVLQQQRERMTRENANMQHALDKLEKMHGKK